MLPAWLCCVAWQHPSYGYLQRRSAESVLPPVGSWVLSYSRSVCTIAREELATWHCCSSNSELAGVVVVPHELSSKLASLML